MPGTLPLHELLQTLGEPNRLLLISTIGTTKMSVSDIVGKTGLSQPLVSHHLRVLKERSIVETERNGPFVLYYLRNARLLDVLGLLTELAGSFERPERRGPMFQCPPSWKEMME
jgi:DNA-binding transcriptional ArsR family regulator